MKRTWRENGNDRQENTQNPIQAHRWKEPLAGIILSGVMIQLAELVTVAVHPVFRGTIAAFTSGLWVGVAAAAVMAVHMERAIGRALAMEEEKAERYMGHVYVLRTVFIVGISLAVAYFRRGYVMASFLGMMCLKFGDFWKPLLRRMTKQYKNKK